MLLCEPDSLPESVKEIQINVFIFNSFADLVISICVENAPDFVEDSFHISKIELTIQSGR